MDSSIIGRMVSTIPAANRSRGIVDQSVVGIEQADLAVFQQHWWLQIAKGNADYHELHCHKSGVIIGTLAFIIVNNRFGNRLGISPIWSHLGGPVVSQALNSTERTETIRQLIAQLPRNISFKFVCCPDDPDANALKTNFRLAGFQCDIETTYLQYPDDIGILERLSGESKRKIVSAAKKLEVIDITADEFISFYANNLTTAGKKSYASLRSARDLIAKGMESDFPQTRVMAARNRISGEPFDAAIAYAWDKRRYYLWMVTHRSSLPLDSQYRPHPHAGKLLILKGTEDARRRGLIFDADGATSEGSQTLYRDRLKFPHTEFRDVFTRDTKVCHLYKKLRSRLTLHGSPKSVPPDNSFLLC